MKLRWMLAIVLIVLSAGTVVWAIPSDRGKGDEIPIGGFVVEQEVVLPGSPETIYDVVTGDLSGWWDHTFSESPVRLHLEAVPGGAFREVFDETGDGALHATVRVAERGKRLIFEGPLGFTGHAIQMVHTYEFEAVGDSTRLALTVRAVGQVEDGWAEAVDGVWRHFLVERLKPYVESGRHLERRTTEARGAAGELLEADRAFAAATAERGIEGWVAFFAPDGAMIRGEGEATGHGAIREAMAGLLADTTVAFGWEPIRADVSAGADLGYTVGRYWLRSRAPEAAGGEGDLVGHGMYVSVWERQPDGSWKVAADIGNPAQQ